MNANVWNSQVPPDETPAAALQEEFSWLMSLALDGLLDAQEQVQFQASLVRYPLLARQWHSWQRLDQQLTLLPAVEPTLGFVKRFEHRFQQQERRQLVWRNWFVGAFIVLVWGGLLVGGTALGAYVLLYQSDWLGEVVHTLAFTFATVSQWFVTLSAALSSLVATPQAIGFGLGYLVAAGALLAYWVRFLRHSTQLVME